jgi:hypothetical protein
MSGSARMVIRGYSERVVWNRHHPGKLALNDLRVMGTTNLESGVLNLTDTTIIGTGAIFTGIDAEQLPQEFCYATSVGNLAISTSYTEMDVTPVGPLLAPRAGRIFRLVAQYSDPVSAGNVTIQPTINGTPVGTVITLSSSEQRVMMDYSSLNLDVEALDLVGVDIETDGLFAPVSAQIHLSIQLYLGLAPVVVELI